MFKFDNSVQWHPSNMNSKVHGANMGPTWVLSAPDGPHVGPINLAIREDITGTFGKGNKSLMKKLTKGVSSTPHPCTSPTCAGPSHSYELACLQLPIISAGNNQHPSLGCMGCHTRTGGPLQYKDCLSRYKNSHINYKMVMRPLNYR